MEETMITNLEANTGKSLADWIRIAQNSGFQKHGEVIKHLKTKHGLTHGYANLVAHKAKKSDAGSNDASDLVSAQYQGKEHLKPLYDALVKEVLKFGDDVELAPKKAYVSLRSKKQFGLIQPSTKTRLDIGLVLKGVEPEGLLEAAGSWNSMVTHRIKLGAEAKLGDTLLAYLRKAYENAL